MRTSDSPVDTDTVQCIDGFEMIDDEEGAKDNLHRPIMIDHQNQLIHGRHRLHVAKKHHKRNKISVIHIDLRQLKATGELTLLHPQGWIEQELKALEQYFKYLWVQHTISNVPEIQVDDDNCYMSITS